MLAKPRLGANTENALAIADDNETQIGLRPIGKTVPLSRPRAFQAFPAGMPFSAETESIRVAERNFAGAADRQVLTKRRAGASKYR